MRGARVRLAAANVDLDTPPGALRLDVGSAAELADTVEQHLHEVDGLVMAAAVADCPDEMILRLAACLRKNGLPTRCDYPAAALASAALSDKKRSGGTVNLIIPAAIGDCRIVPTPVNRLKSFIEAGL